MYYKKIAVINDNPIILQRFIKVIRELNINESIFHFFCSPETDVSQYPYLKIRKIKLKTDFKYLIDKNFDLVFSLHCKQIFPKKLISQIKSINFHPGYNPINRGWYPHIFAIINGLEVGATIHEIDEFVDHGAIIDRIKIDYFSWDTSDTVYDRILDAEISLIKKNIINILNNNYKLIIPENDGNYFSKKDFDALCEINLDESATYEIVFNRLRALTHNNHKNAWYIDKNTGKKVFVSINFNVDAEKST